jgi:Flp pilus assembly protein TadG
MPRQNLLSRLNPRLKWRGIRGLRYNEQGISAVEFALIAPLLIILYLGAIELSLLMEVDRRVTQTSASLGDLTARLSTVTDSDMAEMFAAAKVLMYPYEADSQPRCASPALSTPATAIRKWPGQTLTT